MEKTSINELKSNFEKFTERKLQPNFSSYIDELYKREISSAYRRGMYFGVIYLLATIGILSLLFSCQKCVQCETTTTTIDLENVPQGEAKESFPVCNRTEIKYWNGRKTLESKGGYKILTYTNCDE
jgi:hypothetical protein